MMLLIGAITYGQDSIFVYKGDVMMVGDSALGWTADEVVANIVTDDFNSYTTATTLHSQTNWNQVGANHVFNCTGTTINPNTDTGTEGYILNYYSGTFNDDQYAELEISGNEATFIGPSVRCSTGENGYHIIVNANSIYVLKMVDGSITSLGDGSPPDYAGTVKITAVGTTISCYWDDVLMSFLSGGTGVYTDSDLSSGNPGVTGRGQLGKSGDNFEGGDL